MPIPPIFIARLFTMVLLLVSVWIHTHPSVAAALGVLWFNIEVILFRQAYVLHMMKHMIAMHTGDEQHP